MRYFILSLLLVAITLTSGCLVTTQDHERLQHRVAELEQEQSRMQEEIRQDMDTLESQLQQALEELEEQVRDRTMPVRTTQADLWSQIRNLRQKVAELEGELQTHQRRLQERDEDTDAAKRLEDRLQDLEQRMEGFRSRLGLDQEPREHNATEPAAEEDPEDIAAEDLYDTALAAFQDREYERALMLWSSYIERNPDSELVPNAYFWQGEAHYQMEEYSQAVMQYQEVLEEYEDSNKHPDALLKQGISFFRLDREDPGRVRLQTLLEEYPDSVHADRAREYLQ